MPKAKQSHCKMFVLDTNVMMHDPHSLFRFAEHDVFLPMVTLEELDNNKKGTTDVARNARQTSRFLDQIVTASDIDKGFPLSSFNSGHATGRLFMQTPKMPASTSFPQFLVDTKNDNQILAVVEGLRKQFSGRDIVLVSKDINMRVKARAAGMVAEDYQNDMVMEDTDLLYRGFHDLDATEFWRKHGKKLESWKEAHRTFYRATGPLCASFLPNECLNLQGDDHSALIVREVDGKTAKFELAADFTHPRHTVWGINARGSEQNFALNLLMDPDIDFVTLLGQAGSGKTLLTLAAGLEQVIERKLYSEIIFTRVTVPVADDIGFLPGTEEEKMAPWMGALEDNLEVLNKPDDSAGAWGKSVTNDLIRARIKVKSLNFMRGRTFLNKFVIVDEAQNLTPKQMKTLITRAGPGTKVICLGNIAQIDTPYLTEGSSGLTYVVDRFKTWQHHGHLTLSKCERSRLAEMASEVL